MSHVCDEVCTDTVKQCRGSAGPDGHHDCVEGPQRLYRFHHSSSSKDRHGPTCWVCDNTPYRSAQKANQSVVRPKSWEEVMAKHRCKDACWCKDEAEREARRRHWLRQSGMREEFVRPVRTLTVNEIAERISRKRVKLSFWIYSPDRKAGTRRSRPKPVKRK